MSELGNILVADDDAACLNLTVGVLRQAGYDCDAAPDAPQAAQMLSAKPYDLLVSDLEMPGNQDMRLIRDVPQIAAGLPVILMTAYPTVESAIQSIQLPVTAYLVKPFNKDELLAQVQRAVQHYQAYRVVRANHQRIQEWHRALEQIAAGMKLSSRQPEPAPWQTLLDLSWRNITEALVDVRLFTQLSARQEGAPLSPEVLNAARPLLLLDALRETIAVLEKTKHAFKSKELGELRRKLESLLVTGENK